LQPTKSAGQAYRFELADSCLNFTCSKLVLPPASASLCIRVALPWSQNYTDPKIWDPKWSSEWKFEQWMVKVDFAFHTSQILYYVVLPFQRKGRHNRKQSTKRDGTWAGCIRPCPSITLSKPGRSGRTLRSACEKGNNFSRYMYSDRLKDIETKDSPMNWYQVVGKQILHE
jgi:hypothetical protein